MLTINFHCPSSSATAIDQEQLARLIESTLQACAIVQGEVTISITSDSEIQQLNHQYRGFDQPTDVLSFEAMRPEDDFVVPDDLAFYLGDIIISAETAARQAEVSGHTPFEEIQLLAIHGILHLLGFDHMTPEDKTIMWAKQAELLQQHNLAHVKPTE